MFAQTLEVYRISFGNLSIPPCPLLEACERGYTNIVLWHLSLGGVKDINEGIDGDNETLLHIASKAGNLQLVNTLLGLGAYLMSRNDEANKKKTRRSTIFRVWYFFC